MFAKILDVLDKPYKDDIYNHLNKNDKFRVTKQWFGLSFVIIFFLIVFSFLFFIKNYTYEPPAIYQVSEKTLANNTYKNQLIALPLPRTTKKALESWAIHTVNNMYNFTFNNFDQQAIKDKEFFTPEAFLRFIESLESINLKGELIKNKQIMSLTVSGTPIIKKIGGEIDASTGDMFWQLEVPAILTTTSGKTVFKNINISMIIILRVDNDRPTGFFIKQMDMNESK